MYVIYENWENPEFLPQGKKIISISLILYLYEMMNMYEIYGEKHFIIYVSHMIMLYILNLQYCVSIISRQSRS